MATGAVAIPDREISISTLRPQARDAVHPSTSPPLQLESELDEERRRGRETLDHDADVLHARPT